MMKLTIVLVMALLTCNALAQQRIVYGPDGKVTGRVTTDSQSTPTIYDAAGRRTGTVTNSRAK